MTYTTIPMRPKQARKQVDSTKQADKRATIALRRARKAKRNLVA